MESIENLDDLGSGNAAAPMPGLSITLQCSWTPQTYVDFLYIHLNFFDISFVLQARIGQLLTPEENNDGALRPLSMAILIWNHREWIAAQDQRQPKAQLAWKRYGTARNTGSTCRFKEYCVNFLAQPQMALCLLDCLVTSTTTPCGYTFKTLRG